jgi:hypothetical protein
MAIPNVAPTLPCPLKSLPPAKVTPNFSPEIGSFWKVQEKSFVRAQPTHHSLLNVLSFSTEWSSDPKPLNRLTTFWGINIGIYFDDLL